MTGPRQLKPGPYRAQYIAWQYDGSHAILWCDKSKGGEHWRRLDEQCNGRFPAPDAKLIAAAPDMLAALRRAEQFISNGIELGFIRMPDADTPDSAHQTPGIVRAAIAKATGASQ